MWSRHVRWIARQSGRRWSPATSTCASTFIRTNQTATEPNAGSPTHADRSPPRRDSTKPRPKLDAEKKNFFVTWKRSSLPERENLLYRAADYPDLELDHFHQVMAKNTHRGRVIERLFESIPRDRITPTVKTWTLRIQAALKGRMIPRAFELLEIMRSEGVEPNIITYNCFLEAIAKSKQFQKIPQIQEMMSKSSTPMGVISYSILIHGYVRADRHKEADALLAEMLAAGMQPNRYIHTTMIQSYVRTKRLNKALELFKEVQDESLDVVVFNSLVDGLMRAQRYQEAEDLITDMQTRGFKPNQATTCTVIAGYVRAREVDKALQLFESMRDSHMRPSVWTYSALISGLAKAEREEEAKKYLEEFKQAYPPERVTSGYNAIVGPLVQQRRYEEADQLLRQMEEEGVPLDQVTHNTFILASIRTQQPGRALEFLQLLRKSSWPTSVESYMPFIGHYGQAGDMNGAMEKLREMMSESIVPDRPIIQKLLEYCAETNGDINSLNQIMDAAQQGNVAFTSRMALSVLQVCTKRQADAETLQSFMNKIPPATRYHESVVPAQAAYLLNYCGAEKVKEYLQELERNGVEQSVCSSVQQLVESTPESDSTLKR